MSIQQQHHVELVHDSTARAGALSRVISVEEGARFKLWAVGKYDTSIRQDDNASGIQEE